MDYAVSPIFGVIRADSFRKTSLHGEYIGADRNLLAEIGLLGRIHLIPECLFFEGNTRVRIQRRFMEKTNHLHPMIVYEKNLLGGQLKIQRVSLTGKTTVNILTQLGELNYRHSNESYVMIKSLEL